MKTAELLQRLENLPAARALLREDAEKALAERKRLVGERATITAELAKQIRALTKARDATVAAATQARAAWRKAADEASAAEGALLAAGHAAETARARIDAALRASAPPSIAVFVAQLDERIAEIQREPPIAEVRAPLDYGERPALIANTYAALNRWLARAAEVRTRAKALDVEDLSAAALEEKFVELREELGAVPGVSEAETSDPVLATVLRRKLERMAGAAKGDARPS